MGVKTHRSLLLTGLGWELESCCLGALTEGSTTDWGGKQTYLQSSKCLKDNVFMKKGQALLWQQIDPTSQWFNKLLFLAHIIAQCSLGSSPGREWFGNPGSSHIVALTAWRTLLPAMRTEKCEIGAHHFLSHQPRAHSLNSKLNAREASNCSPPVCPGKRTGWMST